jgi:antitoxin (DNA-binding transcriptional repressor) of toxin-antitoxin stability system
MEVAINHFQNQYLQIFNALQTSQEEVIVTENGHPIAKIIPFPTQKAVLFGRMAGTAKILGDIEQPLGEIWNAE